MAKLPVFILSDVVEVSTQEQWDAWRHLFTMYQPSGAFRFLTEGISETEYKIFMSEDDVNEAHRQAGAQAESQADNKEGSNG